MTFHEIVEYLRAFNIVSVCLRMVLACALGGLLGLNRERNRQAAGLRTYYAVCLGAATTVLLSQYLYFMMNTQWAEVSAAVGISTDVSRLGAQVINGIGFLGAGAILVTKKHHVRGLTTAAGLWACACMGLAIGAGFYELVITGFLLLTGAMVIVPYLNRQSDSRLIHNRVRVVFDDISAIGDILSHVRGMDLVLETYEFGDEPRPFLDLDIKYARSHNYVDLVDELSSLSAVSAVCEQ